MIIHNFIINKVYREIKNEKKQFESWCNIRNQLSLERHGTNISYHKEWVYQIQEIFNISSKELTPDNIRCILLMFAVLEFDIPDNKEFWETLKQFSCIIDCDDNSVRKIFALHNSISLFISGNSMFYGQKCSLNNKEYLDYYNSQLAVAPLSRFITKKQPQLNLDSKTYIDGYVVVYRYIFEKLNFELSTRFGCREVSDLFPEGIVEISKKELAVFLLAMIDYYLRQNSTHSPRQAIFEIVLREAKLILGDNCDDWIEEKLKFYGSAFRLDLNKLTSIRKYSSPKNQINRTSLAICSFSSALYNHKILTETVLFDSASKTKPNANIRWSIDVPKHPYYIVDDFISDNMSKTILEMFLILNKLENRSLFNIH